MLGYFTCIVKNIADSLMNYIKIMIMKYTVLFCLILCPFSCQQSTTTLTSALRIVQYEPLTFQLMFNMPVDLPKFQLLINHVEKLDYIMLSNSTTPQTTFYFSSDGRQVDLDTVDLQSYQLLFNFPLNIGNGQLSVEYHILTAEKMGIQIDVVSALGTTIIFIAYFSTSFTVLGHLMIQFIQVFTLLMFRVTLKTTIHLDLAKYFFLAYPIQLNSQNNNINYIPSSQSIIIQLTIPFGLMLITLLIGMVARKYFSPKIKTPFVEIIYQFLAYNLFISCATTFVFCLYFNALQWLLYTSPLFENQSKTFNLTCFILAYLNLAAVCWYGYLKYYKLNPKCNQTQESWKQERKTESFSLFYKLHEGIIMKGWLSRNKHVISLLKRIFLATCFFFLDGFVYIILFMQFAHLFYIFTVRPFKRQFYLNSFIIFRILFFLYCAIVAVGQLYYLQGSDILLSYSTAKDYVLFLGYLFVGLNLLIICTMCFEVYQKYGNSIYKVQVLKQGKCYSISVIKQQDDSNISDVGTERKMSISSRSVRSKRSKSTSMKLIQKLRKGIYSGEKDIKQRKSKENSKCKGKSNKIMKSKSKDEIDVSKIYDKSTINGNKLKQNLLEKTKMNLSPNLKDHREIELKDYQEIQKSRLKRVNSKRDNKISWDQKKTRERKNSERSLLINFLNVSEE